MDSLYCPWRSSYVTHVVHGKDGKLTADECVFCDKLAQNNDEEHFVLYRGNNVVVLLNLYPYNAGHLLILPLAHVECLSELASEVRHEFIDVTTAAVDIVKRVLKADGVNVGFNIHKASGAGLPGHLHQHVLPRWSGDTNFLPLLAGTKQVSVDLVDVYKKLIPVFNELSLV